MQSTTAGLSSREGGSIIVPGAPRAPDPNIIYPTSAPRSMMVAMVTRRQLLAAPAFLRARSGAAAERPNIIWILGDDLGCELGCYGDRSVRTPNLDRLAAEGTRFTQFHTTAPVCSASRSAFNVGLYQTTTGTQNHRSHRKDGYVLPQ